MNTTFTYIYEVYRERSFSRAAKNLNVTQPALSSCIKKAEIELGTPLFDRSTLPVRMTEAGEIYVQGIKKILAAEKEMETQLSELSSLERGHLKIGGSSFYSACMLPRIVNAYCARYPGVDLEIMDADTNELYRDADREGIELILDGGSCDTQEFDHRVLMHEYLVFAVPTQDPINEELADFALTREELLCGDKRVDCIDLRHFGGRKLILMQPGHDLHARAKTLLDRAGITQDDAFYVNQLTTAAGMAANGLGCTFLTDSVARLWLNGGDQLRFYCLDGEIAHREVFLAWRRKGVRTKAMQYYQECAEELYAASAQG